MADGPPKKKAKEKWIKITEIAVIKKSLKSALKQPYADDSERQIKTKESDRNKSELRNEIERIVIEMTKIMKGGSLNVHVSLNRLFHTGTRKEIEDEFKKHVDRNFFDDYFRGMTMLDGTRDGYILDPKVRELCEKYAIEAPQIESIGNMFNFSSQKYRTNFMNNICVHAYSRIRKYFYSKIRSKKRVYDTLHFLFHHDSEKTPDETLIEALIQLRPINFNNNGAGYFNDMEKKWYQYVPLFMELQG